MERLAGDFIPGAFDVICSRGKAAYRHTGNRSFRATLEHHLPSYANARSKVQQEKTEIVSLIYHGIQEATPEGGFIRKNAKGEWCRVPSHVAREKVGQGFRDLLHTEYRSSTKAKIQRRRERLYPPTKISETPHREQTDEKLGVSSATEMPPLNKSVVSKSFFYDNEPLPLDEPPKDEMSLLSKYSFSSFISSEETQRLSSSDESRPAFMSTGSHRSGFRPVGAVENQRTPVVTPRPTYPGYHQPQGSQYSWHGYHLSTSMWNREQGFQPVARNPPPPTSTNNNQRHAAYYHHRWF